MEIKFNTITGSCQMLQLISVDLSLLVKNTNSPTGRLVLQKQSARLNHVLDLNQSQIKHILIIFTTFMSRVICNVGLNQKLQVLVLFILSEMLLEYFLSSYLSNLVELILTNISYFHYLL